MCGADPRELRDLDHRDAAERAAAAGIALTLRRSYGCDCVERWDRRPGRITLPTLEGDPAEQVLDGIERDTGTRPSGCPWRALRDPFVQRVLRAHRGFAHGDMSARLGGRTPAALVAGVEAFDAAKNAIEAADIRADRAEAERKRAGPHDTPPRTPRTRIKRR
jgi:hypothetical protein